MRRFLVFLSLSLFLVPAFAQFTGSVQGTVMDQSGAVIGGASVSLTNGATGIVIHSTTNESGQYRFLSLPPSNYTVTVVASGFEQASVKAIVQTEETVGVDVKLKVGSIGEKVTVTTEAQTLNPEETRVEYTLETQDLENLPSQNHSTMNYIKLAPGVTTVANAGNQIEGFTDLTPNRNMDFSSANGLGPQSNLYTLDNVPINSVLNEPTSNEGQINGAIIFTPNPDSLAEVSLQSTSFNVDYGTAASMQVSLATKSGSNKPHGSADWTYNDRILNAPAFLQSNTTANHENLDSFSLGGPIIKNHTFFFGSYEHMGTYGAGSGTAQWWSPEFQTFIATADAQSVNVNKFMLANPATRVIDDGHNPVTAQTIFGSPTTCTDPTSTVTQFNIPCSMRVTYEGVAAAPSIIDGKNWDIRGDHTWHGGKDRIYAFYFNMNQSSNSQSPNPTWDGETPSNGYDFTTNYTHAFNSNLLNSATFAITDFNFIFTDTPHSTLLLQMPFLTQIYDAGSISGFTRYVPFGNTERQIYGRDALLWTRGKHSFAFGIEAANNEETDTDYVFGRPFIYAYYSTLDFLTDTLDQETVLSHYSALSGGYQPFIANGTNIRFGLYAEDSWKITPHLTVNYGVRWDDFGNPSPCCGSNAWADTIYTSSDPAQIAATIASRTVKHAYSSARDKNILARGGFAWTPKWFTGARQIVVHGGAGLYQNFPQMENITSVLPSNPPYGAVGATFTSTTADQPILSYGTQSTTAPYGFVFPAGPTGTFNPDGSPVGAPINLGGNDPNLAVPKSIIWNLAVEKELPANIVVGLNYTGTHSYNQSFVTDLNRPVGSDYCTISGANVLPNGTTCTNPTYYPVNPDWASITPTRAGTTANYNGFIAQVQQRWHTLNWQGSYTWSHTLDIPSGMGSSGMGQIELQYNPQAQYGSSDSDVRRRFTASYSYEIPVPKLLREPLGGWSLSGEVVAQTGGPFTPYYSDAAHDFTGSGGNGTYYTIPDYTGTKRSGWSKSEIKAGIFSNLGTNPAAAFPAPACGSCIGNVGRNTFWGAGYATWDQSLVRKITFPWFGDGKSVLLLRAQAFNSLNKVNFETPSFNSSINTGNFGLSPGAFQGRVIDLGGRFEF